MKKKNRSRHKTKSSAWLCIGSVESFDSLKSYFELLFIIIVFMGHCIPSINFFIFLISCMFFFLLVLSVEYNSNTSHFPIMLK